MYKTFSVKCIICLALVLMMAMPLVACQPPLDDDVDAALPTDVVGEATDDPAVEPADTEEALNPDDTEAVEPTEGADETEVVTTEAAQTGDPKTEAPQKTESAKTEAPKTEAPKTAAPNNNKKMGKFTAEDLNGKSYSSSSMFAENKLTMINCWFTGCGPCIKEMPEIQQIANDFASRGVKVYGVLQDSEDDANKINEAKEILSAAGVSYPNLRNQDSVRAVFFTKLNVRAFPTTFFVDSEGYILRVATGSNNYDSWARILNELLAGM